MIESDHQEGGIIVQKRIKNVMKKTIVSMAKKSASLEANTACPAIGFQPKEPQEVKKLRKF